jgi:hypothetical protein
MTNEELIEQLKTLPPKADVLCLWDGSPRSEIEHAWLSHSGQVILADNDEVCYAVNDRPVQCGRTLGIWRSPLKRKAPAPKSP